MKPNQKHEEIKISELRLWSENPRDPIIDANTDDLDIIMRAIKDDKKKWNLQKMMDEMGEYYDNSELPTVVYHEKKPIVYDGNRRIAILKYLQNPDWHPKLENKLSLTRENEDLKNMKEITCNVCDEETALKNIERKHTNSGSWKELERDYFLWRHRGKEKSIFIKLDENTSINGSNAKNTGIIGSNAKMNQRFVKEEIITPENLKEIGFGFKEDKLVSNYDENNSKKILNNIVEMIKDGKINTRGDNRGELKKSLEENFPDLKNIINLFNENNAKPVKYEKEELSDQENNKDKETRRQNRPNLILFGEELILERGDTNDTYKDMKDLFDYWKKNKRLSKTFPNLIRMGLRLLVECASNKDKIEEYIKKHFQEAKNKLNQDEKTTLSNNSTSQAGELIKLLNTGAHNYTSSSNVDQTIAMSLIIGEMLKISHGK